MASNRYLLEVGTEELPAGFLASAPGELEEKLKATLQENRLTWESLQVFATPRRLAVLVEGLPEVQPSATVKIKGPPVRVGLDAQGQPSPAGLGFARKVGVEFAQLRQETLEGETYLVLEQTESGKPTGEILAEVIPAVILGLSGSHFMTWGSNTIKFSRPIRWVVSLWNNTHLPLSIGHLTSGTVSQGHRVLSSGGVAIPSAADYRDVLATQGHVLADPQERREQILAALEAAAQSGGGRLRHNDDLLETVTMLVEAPTVVLGRFQERFLDIPQEVITTVMSAHQKYFPMDDAQGGLLPCFLTVSNGHPDAVETIRQGNERVLTARLEDARFFFDEDRKTPLAHRVEALRGLTFQKGLGTLYEKTQRLVTLATAIGEALAASPPVLAEIQRGALLAKADLVTGMVRELTELQGVMGRQYALLEGEAPAVADAIFEHYLPRFMGDAVARQPVGIAVSLADKLDTLVAVFSQKNARLPSGSKDPLGLRRMAGGLIQTILENRLSLNLTALIQAAYQGLEGLGDPKQKQDAETTCGQVASFILQRLKGILLDQNIRYDVIDAVLEAGDPLADLGDAVTRMGLLKELTQQPERLQAIVEPANRVYRILGEAYEADVDLAQVDPALFRHPSEGALLEALKPLIFTTYPQWIDALVGLSPTVAEFFNEVLVNDPDEAVRQNRYRLLSGLNRAYLKLACFSKLVL